MWQRGQSSAGRQPGCRRGHLDYPRSGQRRGKGGRPAPVHLAAAPRRFHADREPDAEPTGSHGAKACLAARRDSGDQAPFYAVCFTASDAEADVLVRESRAGSSKRLDSVDAPLPGFLRIVREGDSCDRELNDGATWTLVRHSKVKEDDLAGPLLVGMTVTSQNQDVVAEGAFRVGPT